MVICFVFPYRLPSNATALGVVCVILNLMESLDFFPGGNHKAAFTVMLFNCLLFVDAGKTKAVLSKSPSFHCFLSHI